MGNGRDGNIMNSEGGTLLIGVNNESSIEGIEADGFESDDKCGLHAKNLLNQHIGAEFSRCIDRDLKTINGKTIVVITCEKVTDPVFLAVGKNEGPTVFLLKKDQITSRKWKSITLLIFRKSPTSRVTTVAPICRASSAIQTSL